LQKLTVYHKSYEKIIHLQESNRQKNIFIKLNISINIVYSLNIQKLKVIIKKQ